MTRPSTIAFQDGPEDMRPEDEATVGFLARATPSQPRHSEGDIVALSNGRLLAAYSRYHTGEGWDGSPAHLVARTSDDGGRTWDNVKLLERSLDLPPRIVPSPNVRMWDTEGGPYGQEALHGRTDHRPSPSGGDTHFRG